MAAMHTYILVCDGSGCFNLFGHSPTDRTVVAVRAWAGKKGWITKRGPSVKMIPGTKKFYEAAIDLCPSCTSKLIKLDPKGQPC